MPDTGNLLPTPPVSAERDVAGNGSYGFGQNLFSAVGKAKGNRGNYTDPRPAVNQRAGIPNQNRKSFT